MMKRMVMPMTNLISGSETRRGSMAGTWGMRPLRRVRVRFIEIIFKKILSKTLMFIEIIFKNFLSKTLKP